MALKKMAKGAPNGEKLGFYLGMQAYTFNQFTFFEAIDKTESLGLHYIEAYPGQRLSSEHGDAQMVHTMPKELYPVVLAKLKAAGITLACYGVCGLENNKAQCRQVFDFAKAMGIKTIVSEPARDAFGLIDKLTAEYGIKVALHNHPKPSPYWSPDIVLEACEGRSKGIGSCSDTGHWMRSGINPVLSLRKLKGRIVSLHLKDLNQFGGEGCHDVPFCTGQADIKACLAELMKQRVKAVFSIEYEYNWLDSVPEIAEGVKNFDKACKELADGK